MYRAITVKPNGIISGVHDSAVPFVANHFARNPELVDDTVVLIPESGEYRTGIHILCYNEDGTLKDLAWCITEGYMDIPPGYELIDGQLVKTDIPAVDAPTTLRELLDRVNANVDNMRDSLLGRLNMLESVRAWSDISRGELVPVDTVVVFFLKRYRCIKEHTKTLIPPPSTDPTRWVEDVPS